MSDILLAQEMDKVERLERRIAELEKAEHDSTAALVRASQCINELQEKLRWRDATTEPPTEDGWYLALLPQGEHCNISQPDDPRTRTVVLQYETHYYSPSITPDSPYWTDGTGAIYSTVQWWMPIP